MKKSLSMLLVTLLFAGVLVGCTPADIGLSGFNSDKWEGFQRDLGGIGNVWNHHTRIGLQPK